MYVALLHLRNPPTNKQLKLLNGLFRIDSIQLVREHLTHNLTSKIIQRCNSEYHLTNSFGRRDRSIIESRSPYNLMHRAILNPLTRQAKRDKILLSGIMQGKDVGVRQPLRRKNGASPPVLAIITNQYASWQYAGI